MLTEYDFWVFKDVIPQEEIVKIKKIATDGGYSSSLIRKCKEEVVPEKDHRDSNAFFSDDDYFYKLLVPIALGANIEAGWNFNIDWYESVQISKYGAGQHYDWHQDGPSDCINAYSEKNEVATNYRGKVRKLTVVALLQKSEEGGHLQCANDTPIGDNRYEFELNVGDAVVFPSYLWHRSAPVTKGEKQSMTMWCLGRPFK